MFCKKKEELSFSNLKKINDFILKDAKWSLERYEKKATKLTVAFILLLIISIISFLVLAYGDFSDEYIKLLGFFILLTIIAYYSAKYFNNKNTLNFTEDNVKAVLKVVNKKFDKSFKTLAEQKEIINTYEKLSKHNLGIPKKDKVSN